MPAQLLVSIIGFYIVLLLFRIPIADAQAQRWMFTMPSARAFAPPWTLAFARVPWSALP